MRDSGEGEGPKVSIVKIPNQMLLRRAAESGEKRLLL